MKTQIIIIVFALMIPILGFSQNKFSIGVNVSSEISKMKIGDSNSQSGIQEKGGFGLGHSAGIQIQYKMPGRTFLRSGINYQNLSHRHKIKGLIFGTDLINETESILQNDISITSIGIPVNFGHKVSSKNDRIDFLIGFGGMINMNLDTKTDAKILHVKIDDEELTKAENQVEESFYSLEIFAGIEIKLNEKFALGIEPNLRITPNNFILYLYESEAKTTFESGLTIRIIVK